MSTCNIKYFGFDFPPNGIINLLKKIDYPQNTIIYILDPFNGKELPYSDIAKETKHNLYIVITTHEGASSHWFDRLIPKLINKCRVAADHIIIRSACLWDPDSTVLNIHTITDECYDFISRFNPLKLIVNNPTHHYVCLNRLHRWQRYQLVQQLLDRNLKQHGKISYVQKPNTLDQRFPILLDYSNVSWEAQRDVSHPDISGALFNVITETAYELEPGSTKFDSHHRPGMTEKSFKCFVMAQVPIWLAPYQSVECYRRLGFDVFDDIIDHSYDLEVNPVTRVIMVADQIEGICQLNNLDILKKKLLPRFEKNIEILKSFNHAWELPQWKNALLMHSTLGIIY